MRNLEFADGGHKGHDAEKHAIQRLSPGECVCFVYGSEEAAARKLRALRTIVSTSGGWARVTKHGIHVLAWSIGGRFSLRMAEEDTDEKNTKEWRAMHALMEGDSVEFVYDSGKAAARKKEYIKQQAVERGAKVKTVVRGCRLFVWLLQRGREYGE